MKNERFTICAVKELYPRKFKFELVSWYTGRRYTLIISKADDEIIKFVKNSKERQHLIINHECGVVTDMLNHENVQRKVIARHPPCSAFISEH